jgi:predicted transcriptional regulator
MMRLGDGGPLNTGVVTLASRWSCADSQLSEARSLNVGIYWHRITDSEVAAECGVCSPDCLGGNTDADGIA